jgi:S-DNA-T family DNA segregation ATPase FtsK/SpoIIIE
MSDDRSRKRDLLALGLLALVVFLLVALATCDPADPPTSLVYPPNDSVRNACGPLGAWTARLLFDLLGLGAYWVLLFLGLLAWQMLRRRAVRDPLVRLAGLLVSLCGVCALATMALPELAPSTAIGAGGYLGAAARSLLEMHFAAAGACILVLSFILGGLLLSTDYGLVRLAAWMAGAVVRSARRLAARRRDKGSCDAADASRASHGTESATSEESRSTKVRISQRSRSLTEPHDTAALEGDEPSSQDEATEPATDAAARALRVRNRHTRREDREGVIQQLEEASRHETAVEYELPSLDLLREPEPFSFEEQEKEVRRKAVILEQTFANFGYNVKVVEIETGPVIAQFEVELEAGLRLSKITGLADDLAVALRVPSVRIVAPLPGKNTVGIEVPNADRQLVRLREVIQESTQQASKMRIPFFLGNDVSGNPMVVDLTTLPHLLIAGRTGTGKSVCLNTLIMSILMTRRPDEVKLLLVDPKMVELTPYARVPHLMHPVVTDMKKAEAILAWAVDKMEERYTLLMRAGVRHLSVYNQLGEEELLERMQPETEEERAAIPRHLPYIVIVADEMADLMMTAPKEVEASIIRLAQKSRAVGIHLVLATQKPTVDVITGLIKSNLPARICFQVASRTDSRVVLDEMGADKLLGNGDMLFLWPGTSTLLRGQGAFVSDEEIHDVVNFLATNEPQFAAELVALPVRGEAAAGCGVNTRGDEFYEQAVEMVLREGRGSVSLLQRALGIGYGRAARLIDYMCEDGIVGPYNGSQAREVLISLEEWQARSGAATPPAAPRRPRNKVVLRDESSRHSPAAAGATTRRATQAPWEADDPGDDLPEEDLHDDESQDDEPPPTSRRNTYHAVDDVDDNQYAAQAEADDDLDAQDEDDSYDDELADSLARDAQYASSSPQRRPRPGSAAQGSFGAQGEPRSGASARPGGSAPKLQRRQR